MFTWQNATEQKNTPHLCSRGLYLRLSPHRVVLSNSVEARAERSQKMSVKLKMEQTTVRCSVMRTRLIVLVRRGPEFRL